MSTIFEALKSDDIFLAAQEELKLRKWNELSKAEQKAAESDIDYLLAEWHNPY